MKLTPRTKSLVGMGAALAIGLSIATFISFLLWPHPEKPKAPKVIQPVPVLLGLPALDMVKEELAPAPKDCWTLAVIPDTQVRFYDEPNNRHWLEDQVRWLRENKEAQRIRFMAHVGDLAQHNDERLEGQLQEVKALLDSTGIPYLTTAGNHDMSDYGDTKVYRRVVGPLVRTAKVEGWTLASVPCAPRAEDLKTLQSAVAGVDGPVLLVAHDFLGPEDYSNVKQDLVHGRKGVMRWGTVYGPRSTPREAWDTCYSTISNLRVILCGHQSRTRAYHMGLKREGGPPVHALLSDYKGRAVRLMRFFEGRIEVLTYNPSERSRIVGERHTFTINLKRGD